MPALNFSEQLLTGNDFSSQDLNGSTFFKAKLYGVQFVETGLNDIYVPEAPIPLKAVMVMTTSMGELLLICSSLGLVMISSMALMGMIFWLAVRAMTP